MLSPLAATGVGKAAVGAAAIAVVVGSVGAGVVFLSAGDAADLSKVPADVDSIQYVDVDGLTEDEAVGSVVDDLLGLAHENGATGAVPADYEGLQARFDEEVGLELANLHTVTSYAQYDDSAVGATDYTAALVTSDWDRADLVGAIESDTGLTLEEGRENGVPVYRPVEDPAFGPTTWVAAFGDGEYAIGTPDAVSDAIDVAQGDAPSASGDLESAFRDARDGDVKFAARLPQNAIPADELGEHTRLDAGVFDDVEMLSGAYYTAGNSLGIELRLYASDEDRARDLADLTEGSVQVARGAIEVEEVEDTLADVEVNRDGAVVTVGYENSVDDITDVLEAVNEESNRTLSDHTDRDEPLRAGASVTADADENTITTRFTDNGNAQFLRVEYAVGSGSGDDESARLRDVGEVHTYHGDDGAVVRVTVVAVAGETSTVVLQSEKEL